MTEQPPFIPSIMTETDIETYQKAGYGFRVGFGRRPAVIVVDMMMGFVEDRYPTGCSKTGLPCVNAIRELLDRSRTLSVPIFYSKSELGATSFESLPTKRAWRYLSMPTEKNPTRDPEYHEIYPDLAPEPGDAIIVKTKPSAFFGTPLHSFLNVRRVDTTIITGMTTSGCVRATVTDAFSLNYRVIIPKECVADRGEVSHLVNLFDMDMKYADVIQLKEVLDHLAECMADQHSDLPQ